MPSEIYKGSWDIYSWSNPTIDTDEEYVCTVKSLKAAHNWCKKDITTAHKICPDECVPLSEYKIVEHADQEKSNYEIYKVPKYSNSLLIKLVYSNDDGLIYRAFAVPTGKYEEYQNSSRKYRDYNNMESDKDRETALNIQRRLTVYKLKVTSGKTIYEKIKTEHSNQLHNISHAIMMKMINRYNKNGTTQFTFNNKKIGITLQIERTFFTSEENVATAHNLLKSNLFEPFNKYEMIESYIGCYNGLENDS